MNTFTKIKNKTDYERNLLEVSEKVVKYPAEKSAGYKGLNPKCHAELVSASNKIRRSKTLKESAEKEYRLERSKIQGDKNLS